MACLNEMIQCSKCSTPTTVDYCFQVSTYRVQPREYLCGPCGGADGQCSEILHLARELNALNQQSIILTDVEYAFCERWAKKRNRASATLKNFKVSQDKDDYTVHLIGAMGEVACRKFRGLPPMQLTINTFRDADLPDNIEVRARTKWWHDLKVRPDDKDDTRIVLAVLASERTIYLAGWIYAKEGKAIGKLIDPRSAGQMFYAVAQEDLHPMKELKI